MSCHVHGRHPACPRLALDAVSVGEGRFKQSADPVVFHEVRECVGDDGRPNIGLNVPARGRRVQSRHGRQRARLASHTRRAPLRECRLCGGEFANPESFPRPFREPEIVLHLLMQPALRRGVERDGQSNGHLGADARTSVKNGGPGVATHAEGVGGLGDAQLQGCQAEFAENLAGMRRLVHAERLHLQEARRMVGEYVMTQKDIQTE